MIKNKNDTVMNNKNHISSSSSENQLWKKIPTTLLLFLSLLAISLFYLFSQEKTILMTTTFTSISDHQSRHKTSRHDTCLGRYIYTHHLPSRFNIDILKDCESITRPKDKTSMCKYLDNSGYGPLIGGKGSDYSSSWYATNQFMLEVIFHEKMKRYECLTMNSSLASAIYIPYYAGLDLRRNLRQLNVTDRDTAGKELVQWLKKQPLWNGMSGEDHFLVISRISQDFRRNSDNNSIWGTNLMLLPESQNLTFLTIERSLTSKNEFAIPYPTYFHPTSTSEILRWQNKIELTNRTILFSFAGAQRPSKNLNGFIRTEVIRQCKSSSKTCRFLDCDVTANSCDDPISLMKLFESSVFCLQPPGDSLTRRSVFDSILAGCIPVFFNQRSAYKQYIWHLLGNNSEYSVYIPVKKMIGGKNKIEEILRGIPNEKVVGMRENVIRLVPKIVYAKPNRNKPDGGVIEDAFDIAVKGVVERIEGIRRKKFQD